MSILAIVFAVSFSQDTFAQSEPDKELRLTEFTPWLVKTNGPKAAEGIIYFMRGWGPPAKALSDTRWAPYFLKTLSENGWDVLEATPPRGPTDWKQRKAATAAAMFVKRRAGELKQQGYRRVILAGHGWGGWIAMIVAQEKDHPVDSLILHAPNGYGPPVTINGEKNPNFKRNLKEFRKLIRNITTPTVLMVFASDEFELGKRGKFARNQFNQRKVPNLIFDKPKGFTGHSAGWLPIFDYAFGDCLQRFLDAPTTQPCKPKRLSNKDFRSVVRINQFPADKIKLIAKAVIVAAKQIVGGKYVVYPLGGNNVHYEYETSEIRIATTSFRVKEQAYTLRNGLHCEKDNCGLLVGWSKNVLLEFHPTTGKLIAWWLKR
ncbi:MAG: hypothetical protein O3A85_06050 [Proteobacteria bacterium]|nr:hypothetical protein [Pseudomonadota bacterium]